MSTASVILSIENLSQSVAALLGNPAAFNTTFANTLITTIQFIKTDVAALPITAAHINEILTVLTQTQNIIISARNAGVITIEQLNTILDLLQLVVLKATTFSLLT